jgi:hypothetical protein
VELRALQSGKEKERHDAWARARMIAHWVYLSIPSAKGGHKETDPTRFFPLPGDGDADSEQTVIHLTDNDIKELNRIKRNIR